MLFDSFSFWISRSYLNEASKQKITSFVTEAVHKWGEALYQWAFKWGQVRTCPFLNHSQPRIQRRFERVLQRHSKGSWKCNCSLLSSRFSALLNNFPCGLITTGCKSILVFSRNGFPGLFARIVQDRKHSRWFCGEARNRFQGRERLRNRNESQGYILLDSVSGVEIKIWKEMEADWRLWGEVPVK